MSDPIGILRCMNCGGTALEIGEAGAPSRCAGCGSVHFTRERRGRNFTITENHAPTSASFVLQADNASPEQVRGFFNELHAFVDSVPSFHR